MEYLNSIDIQAFLFINSQHNAFFDFVMYWLSDKLVWVPMYLLIAFFILKHYRMKGVVILLINKNAWVSIVFRYSISNGVSFYITIVVLYSTGKQILLQLQLPKRHRLDNVRPGPFGSSLQHLPRHKMVQ